MSSTQPSTTLYVTNLDDKLKKEDLRRVLYMIFSIHGKVLDVVSLKGEKRRGQAFVVFRDLQGSAAAMRRESGNIVLGKPLRIAYAKGKSHATVLQEEGPDALFRVKQGIFDAKAPKLTVSAAEKTNVDAEKAKALSAKREREAAEEDEDEEEETSKRPKINGHAAAEDDEAAMEEDSDDEVQEVVAPNGRAAAPINPPSHVLQVTAIPFDVTNDMMDVLFKQYGGVTGIRYTPSRDGGTALVTYESVQQATVAQEKQHGFQMAPGQFISVSFARP